MIYLLDTDILIYWINGTQNIEEKVVSTGLENISISIITKAELYYGAYNSKYKEKNLNNIHVLAEQISILNFDDKSARLFGEIKSFIKNKGLPILDADIMIASIALANDLILVTNNTSHFERIPDLIIENWLNTK